MLRLLFEELVLPLLLILLLRSIITSLFGRPRRRQESRGPARGAPQVPQGGELRRDPVCGTFVSTAVSLTKTVKGEVVYFCSKECRDKFAG
ncbi:MAG TPA: hypothetical protein VML19_35170 [Verrucomicrobiae bacterium]|nr:hypothetical protein [Verrucomicrobiae bacterium]